MDGLTVGHATDLAFCTGVTAIICAHPMTASVAVLGGAPGGHDLGPLDPAASIDAVDAIVLSGGSAYGLAAAGGVQAWLRANGRGRVFAGRAVPLVAAAVLFDLVTNDPARWDRFPPYRDLGWAAAEVSSDAIEEGSIGAGTGAATATLKGGIGVSRAVTESGHAILALAAVNAMGTATIGDGPHFWAAPYEVDGEFGNLGWPSPMPADSLRLRRKHQQPATTLGLVATDARLTKAQAHRLALMAHDGLARAVLPAHAPMDGDTIFALSTGAREMTNPVAELTELGHLAAITFARAVARGVYLATPLLGLTQTWREKFGHTEAASNSRV